MEWNTDMRKYVLAAILGVILSQLSAQRTPQEELTYYKAKYPRENAVILKDWRTLSIDVEGDSLVIFVESYEEKLILNNPLQWTKNKVYTSSFTPVEELEAYTLVPDKKKYRRVDVTEFKRSFDKDSYVFYDDSEWVNFTYPMLTEGARIVTRHKWRLTDPHIISQFHFGNYVPCISSRYTIRVDPRVRLEHGLLKGDSAGIVLTQQKTDKIEFVYNADTLEPLKYEADNPSFEYLSPSVYVNIAGYMNDRGEKITVLSSLEDLHQWYLGFLKDITTDDQVRTLAVSLVDPDDTELERVRKIYYWVQKNVKYIAFEQGMRGFIPHSPGYVLEKRYGDCKDMSSLLVGLLRSVGLKACYTWIGTRDIPYDYTEIPSPIVDNHMIAAVEIDGTIVFLDATGSYMPLGLPTSMIQGKQALISCDSTYQIERVPVMPGKENQLVDTTYVRLENGTLTGRGHATLTGYVRVNNMHRLIRRDDKDQEDYVRRLLAKGSNKFFLEDYSITDLDNLDQPITIDYDFRVEDYYRAIGDEIYVNLNLEKSLMNQQIKDRSTPVESDFKFSQRNVTILDLGEESEVTYLPENSEYVGEHFGYHITYDKQGDRIVTTNEFYVDYLLLQPSHFEKWNQGVKAYSEALRNTVSIKYQEKGK